LTREAAFKDAPNKVVLSGWPEAFTPGFQTGVCTETIFASRLCD